MVLKCTDFKNQMYTTARSWKFGKKYILTLKKKTLGGTLKNDYEFTKH